MMLSKKKSRYILTSTFLISIFFVNLISQNQFVRADLTKQKKFTLSSASRKTMQSLDDSMVVTAYFSEGLPMPYASYARYVQDLLEEYRSASGGKFAFEFVDPLFEETAEDKVKKKQARRDIFGRLVREQTSIELELANLGVEPVEIRMLEDDNQQTKRAYMGIVIHFEGKKEVIPVVQDILNLEKDMTLRIRKLVQKKPPQLAVVNNLEGVPLNKWFALAKKSAEIKLIDSLEDVHAWRDADALVVLGNPKKITQKIETSLDKMLEQNKGVALLLNRYSVDLQTFSTIPEKKLPLAKWLKKSGVKFGDDMVADVDCATLNMSEKRGGMYMTVPVKYPFVPEVKRLDQNSPLTRGLAGVLIPFSSSVQFIGLEQQKADVLLSSGKSSWLEEGIVNTSPHRNWDNVNIVPTGPHNLMIQVKNAEKSGRLLVAGTSAFLWDAFINGPNEILSLNLIDWIVAEDDLLSMRSRNYMDLPIGVDLSEEMKSVIKYSNILGVPLLLILYGLLRWRLRENRRNRF